MQPNLDEAILFFNSFHWENEKEESVMKVLMFQSPSANDSSIQISSLEKGKWDVSVKVSNRRRFLGPFLKRDTFKIFIDKNKRETEKLIRLFYQSTLSEFTAILKSS